jgi:hypothetical protein
MTRRIPARLRQSAMAALVAAAVAFPLTAAALPAVPAPEPVRFGAAAGAAERYAANSANLREAERTARDAGRTGRAVEVFGDLAAADRIAVLVPGSDTSLDTYGRFRAGAASLARSVQARHPRSAVVAWLGYETPGTFSPAVLGTGRAQEAARLLGAFTGELHGMNPRARVALLCHSYGSVVCARTETGPAVTDTALYGSPGTGVDRAGDLPGSARVWAGRGGTDWIGHVPHVRLELPGTAVGFGRDPVDPAFGARIFEAGPAGHSDYLEPGSAALGALTQIALGRTPAGTAPADAPAQEATRG